MKHDKILQEKLVLRAEGNKLRELKVAEGLIDFCSNDYLGFARCTELAEQIESLKLEQTANVVGSGGSRLISGNTSFIERLESELAEFLDAGSVLLFNSGYSANIGFFSSVPQRGDVVFYDELIHASIRDGIKLGVANSFSFKHNDLENLKNKIATVNPNKSIFVVVESVYSMDGDSPEMVDLADYCFNNDIQLVVDEAHSFGLYGERGQGIISELGLQEKTYARILTFGKALGCHGAAIAGSAALRPYLINYARSFIYTTALSIHDQKAIYCSLERLKGLVIKDLNISNIVDLFGACAEEKGLQISASDGAIRSVLFKGNENAKNMEEKLRVNGLSVKAILSPTVPEGQERIRVCLHDFNTPDEVRKLVNCLHNG
jgi:8-amino-7-oxononanoate synthase